MAGEVGVKGTSERDTARRAGESAGDWWRDAVVYQVYIRSFADGNGDGTGDIAGLRSRLDHLDRLGVDAIWINPWYPSPLNDGGYDVADFRDINPQFGTLDEAEQLLREAHERGIKVIVDLVPNHTSDQHRWFQEAIRSPLGSPARARYVIRPGKGPDGATPPTNWKSVFGGPAWSRLPDGEWYLHLFDVTQPDLNWEHEEIRAEFVDIFRFWLERGVDGFRVDVAHGMIKDQTFPDLSAKQELLSGSDGTSSHPFWDRDGVHEVNRQWRAVLDEYDDRMMVAEAWVAPERLPLYFRVDEYHQSFNFDLLAATWEAKSFRTIISNAVTRATAIGASPTWVLSNHDVMRHATRYGLPPETNWRAWPVTGPHDALDVELGQRRARAAALVLLSLPGSAYVYQGEELGLPEVWDLPPEVLDDPVWERSGHEQKGRDGCRVPIPWTAEPTSFGFGQGRSWLPQPETFGALSVEQQQGDPTSMLSLYRDAIAIRPSRTEHTAIFEMIDLGSDVLAYRHGSLQCIVNMGDDAVALPGGKVLLASGTVGDGRLGSDVAVWLEAD